MSSLDNFYEQLPVFSNFSHFSQLDYYSSLPSEWLVVITDIQGSTKAISEGLYKEVNSMSTASVVSVLNVFSPLKIPYVFGGDGATICIPPSKLESVRASLAASRQLAERSFGLKLRVGIVPMSIIQRENRRILIGKYQPSAYFQQAMFHGDGLRYAESLVKDEDLNNPYIVPDEVVPEGSFEGYECRWNEVPSSQEETVAIMIQVVDQHGELEKLIYEEITENISRIYGNENMHHPIQSENLSLSFSLNKLSIETRIRTATQGAWKRFSYLLKLCYLAGAGKYLMHKNIKTGSVDWGQYKQNFIANTDYRKFDETLRMVISGTVEQRHQLARYLGKLHSQKKIVFGMQPSSGAIVTCLVSDYDKDHIHFVDGSNGGYAMAASKMKQQLNEWKV